MNQRHRPVVYALVAIAVGVLVVMVLALMVKTWSLTDQIRSSQVNNTAARKSSDRTLAAIEDCTKPTGDCYQRGQKRTAAAVGDINRVVILASACSSGLSPDLSIEDRQARIQQCVIDRLAASGAR